MKIMVVATGGTIGSVMRDGVVGTDVNGSGVVEKVIGEIKDIEFDVRFLMDVLSENLTFSRVAKLAGFLKAAAEDGMNEYGGIVILHGTDTLAYTSSLLALALAGFQKPLFLVSSNLTLDREESNGVINFRTAVGLIRDGFGPGVYVPYRNSDGVVYLHHGAHMLQSANYSDDFFSFDMKPVGEAVPYEMQTDEPPVIKLRKFSACVMKVEPYMGLDYSALGLPEGVRAVMHGSYHSGTACVERRSRNEAFTKYSALYLLHKCAEHGVDFWLSGLSGAAGSMYSSTADLLLSGARPVYSLTNETAYMKLTLAYLLGYSGDGAAEFMTQELVSEKIR